MPDPSLDGFVDHVARIRKIQALRISCDDAMAKIYRSARAAHLDVPKLKAAAKEIFAEIKANGDAALQSSAIEGRAQAERGCPPELQNYDDGLGPIGSDSNVLVDDLIGK